MNTFTHLRRLPALGVILGMAFFITGCGPMTFVVGVTPGDQRMTRTVVDSDGPGARDRVAIIDVTGLIISTNRPGLLRQGENPVSRLHEQLAMAENDARVKAVILRINSPGGTVTASDAMYREVQRFRERTGKPVVALMMDVAASGGYYVACAADEIVAYPTSITGSIGVIVQTFSVKPALARIGIMTETIASGPNKAAGSPFGHLTDEHREIFQQLVNDFYGRFRHVVIEARPAIDESRLPMVTDGRVVSGEQALDMGLVDVNGDLYDAFERAKALANVQRAQLIRYHRPLEYVGSPYAGAPGTGETAPGGTQINLLQLNLADSLPGLDAPVGFYYLWLPEGP